MRIPLSAKGPHHVKPIPIGKPWIIESTLEPTKASVKVKYFWRERLLSKYLRSVTEFYLVDT